VHQALSLLQSHFSQPEAFDPATSTRRFTLCTTDYVECVLIPPLVKKLAVEAPNVHIDITILREEIRNWRWPTAKSISCWGLTNT
jgi:DNA-binding transcriptional LysR family regulator